MLVDLILVERELVPDDVRSMEDAQNRLVHRHAGDLRELRQIVQLLKRPALIGRYLCEEREAN